jgi:hypothetical protein
MHCSKLDEIQQEQGSGRQAVTLVMICCVTEGTTGTSRRLAASFAALPFETHTTVPPRNSATAAAIAPGSKRIAPKSRAASTTPLGNPRG